MANRSASVALTLEWSEEIHPYVVVISAVRYTEASATLRRAMYWGGRDLGVAVVEVGYFTPMIASMALELTCACIYLEAKDYLVFILYFWLQNAQQWLQHTGKTQQGFIGRMIT